MGEWPSVNFPAAAASTAAAAAATTAASEATSAAAAAADAADAPAFPVFALGGRYFARLRPDAPPGPPRFTSTFDPLI